MKRIIKEIISMMVFPIIMISFIPFCFLVFAVFIMDEFLEETYFCKIAENFFDWIEK